MTIRLAVLLFVATAPGLAAQARVQAEIQAEVARYVTTVNRGDPQGLASLYARTPEASSLGDGAITRGWPAILDLIEDAYRQSGRIVMRADSVVVVPLGGDAALAYFRYTWVLGRGDDARTLRGAMTLVYARMGQGWRVVHDHTSTLSEPAAVPPPAVLRDSSLPGPVRDTQTCVVAHLVDGDTFECRGGPRVRLIGMDSPELSQRPYGLLAFEALAGLMPAGTEVRLERDVEPTDRYGRQLAYVWRDTVMINWAMVRNGWAVLLTYPPNVQYVERFEAAQRTAREERVGLWAVGGFDCRPADRRRGRCD